MTRTGFMSLPAELRLRIYEYALDPRADPGAFGRSRLGKGHQDCCALSPRKNTRRCNCARNKITTGLLRASKEVSYEALRVLCNLCELRVRIPRNDGQVKIQELSNILEKIPEHALKHIRQLLLVSENASAHDFDTLYRDHQSDPLSRTNRPDGLAGIDKYWKVIKQQLPQLRKIRIHVDLFTAELKNLKFVLWAFKGVKTLPKLQVFRLEIHQRHTYQEEQWSEQFMEDTQAALICKVLQLVQGNFEVDIELIKVEAARMMQWRSYPYA